MSDQNPPKPRPRRRIAGERRPTRPGEVQPEADGAPVSSGGHTDEGRAHAVPLATGPGAPSVGSSRLPTTTSADRPAPAVSEPRRSTPTRGPGPSWPVIGVLGALAVVLVAAAAVLGLAVWDIGEVREHDKVDQASRVAPAAAERASAAILSYDYTSLDADRKAAQRHMTPSYKKKYGATFERLVRPNAAKVKARVEAEVKASGVSHADPDRVNVLLYVNQTTTSTANGGEPQVALNRVQFSMVRQGGSWLVNDITSY